MQTFEEVGYLDGEALSTLRSIYESMLTERGIPYGTPGAEELAARIVNLYLSGMTDEAEIRQMLDRPQAA